MQDWSKKTDERPRVPVLQYWGSEGNETIMPESNEINFFLDSVDGSPHFTPEEGSEGWNEMKKWWSWCDDEMKPVLDLYKYGKDRKWDRESNELYKKELGTYIEKLEKHLENKKFMVEDRLTLTDIAIIPFVRQIMRVRDGEFDFGAYPRVTTWANQILEADWFQTEVMKKHPLAPVGE